MRLLLLSAALPAIAVSACSAADSTSGAATTTAAPSATLAPDADAPAKQAATVTPGTPPSTVLVRPSAVTRALTTFVRAHADSVNSGSATPELIKVAGDAELARQRVVVDFAAERGYAVPARPVVAVVSASTQAPRARSVELGVCVWLPSTEYIDAETGQPPSGPVPQQWAPAVATLSRPTVTWVVDTLASPEPSSAVDCREVS